MNKILLLSVISCFGLSCVNNVEDEIPEIPDEPISYATQIQPIFNNSCGGGFCHTNGDNVNGVPIVFVEVDCEKEKELANKYKIEGYPTIKLIYNGQIIEYDAKPDVSTLKEFLNTSIQ